MPKKSSGLETALTASAKVLTDKISALRSEMQTAAKAGVSEHLEMFFDAHPEVAALRWVQYTPYFNDGDECIFRVNDIEFLSKEPDGEDEKREYSYGEGDYNFAAYDSPAKKIIGNYAGLEEDMDAVKSTFSAIEPTMKEIYGDHVLVYINREGSETFEYEHD